MNYIPFKQKSLTVLPFLLSDIKHLSSAIPLLILDILYERYLALRELTLTHTKFRYLHLSIKSVHGLVLNQSLSVLRHRHTLSL